MTKKKNKPSLVSGGTAPLTAFLSCFKNRSTSLLSWFKCQKVWLWQVIIPASSLTSPKKKKSKNLLRWDSDTLNCPVTVMWPFSLQTAGLKCTNTHAHCVCALPTPLAVLCAETPALTIYWSHIWAAAVHSTWPLKWWALALKQPGPAQLGTAHHGTRDLWLFNDHFQSTGSETHLLRDGVHFLQPNRMNPYLCELTRWKSNREQRAVNPLVRECEL